MRPAVIRIPSDTPVSRLESLAAVVREFPGHDAVALRLDDGRVLHLTKVEVSETLLDAMERILA